MSRPQVEHNEPITPRARGSLLRPRAIERLENAAVEAPGDGTVRLAASIAQAARATLPSIDACLADADDVVAGRIAAANRIWLRLRAVPEPLEPRVAGGARLDIAGPASVREPKLIRGERLVDLLFGVVRAASTPREADAMLEALGDLLEPVFRLEDAYFAIEEARRGNPSPWRSAIAAWDVDRPEQPPPGHHVRGGGFRDIWGDRSDFDQLAWTPPWVSTVTGRWTSWPCAGAAPLSASVINVLEPPYSIESLSDPYACPGTRITIRGRNFGPNGRVRFQPPDPEDPDYPADHTAVSGITPVTWTDTQIDVVVPSWARAGELRLLAYRRITEQCLTTDVYRLGNSVMFKGGLPHIYELKVNGRDVKAWVPPSAYATVSWVTSYSDVPLGPFGTPLQVMTADDAVLDVRNVDNPAAPHWHEEDLPEGVGSTQWLAPVVLQPTHHVASLSVPNNCGTAVRELPVLVIDRPELKIEGVEVTQGIQTFSFTGGWRNTIPTVAFKDTIVRVYASANRPVWTNTKLNHVTAWLSVGGQVLAPINDVGGSPTKFLDIGHSSKIQRDSTNASFNFRIPAALCTGTKTIAVEVSGADEIGPMKASASLPWTWASRPPLKVRSVRVSYNGMIPDHHQARRTLLRAIEPLPYPPTDIGEAWLQTWTTSVTDLTSDDGRQTLLDHLHDQHNCTLSEWVFPWEDDCPDDDGARWIGVVPADVGGKAKTGKNTVVVSMADADSIGVASAPVATGGLAAAHELGHTLCLCHVNRGCNGTNPATSSMCGSFGSAFDALPFDGRIVDVPFDPTKNRAVTSSTPGQVWDFMSYACDQWISQRNWERLFLFHGDGDA